jgi:hypothetical protein
MLCGKKVNELDGKTIFGQLFQTRCFVEGKSMNWMEKQFLGNFFKLDVLWKKGLSYGRKQNVSAKHVRLIRKGLNCPKGNFF